MSPAVEAILTRHQQDPHDLNNLKPSQHGAPSQVPIAIPNTMLLQD